MEKKQSIQEQEYETPDLTVTDVQGEHLEIEPEVSDGVGSDLEVKPKEVKPKEEKPEEDEPAAFLSGYPETATLLRSHPEFKPGKEIETFMATVEGFARGSRLEKERVDKALKSLFSMGIACIKGSPTLDMLELLLKGESHDRELEEKVKAAELRGRNAVIEAGMRSKPQSDGLPHVESRGPSSVKRNRGIFSLAESARK